MDVFEIRKGLIKDYASYTSSFIKIEDEVIGKKVQEEMEAGLLWPDPLLQLNPAFETGASIDELVEEGILHEECARIFRVGKTEIPLGRPLRLHTHQDQAIRIASKYNNYILTTGTGSGKSLAYIIPIVNHVLKQGSGKGTQAIIVYPMNALANSQLGELEKFLCEGYPDGRPPVTFARYTGQENDEEKEKIMANPPDILLTNYVMLELILVRPRERRTLVRAAQDLRFLVLDELHTYRGRQGSDVAMLVRRVRGALSADNLQCVGTSATLAGSGTYEEQQAEVADVASQIFGANVKPEHVVGETLKRATIAVDFSEPAAIESLKESAERFQSDVPSSYEDFLSEALTSWIETTFGVEEEQETGRLIRANPRSISGDKGGAKLLSSLINQDKNICQQSIERCLLSAYEYQQDTEAGFPPFAFRIHQFISRGDTAYASLEDEKDRYVTVNGQQFVPGDRERILLPLTFCRECGQEYYSVFIQEREENERFVSPREFSNRNQDDSGEPGYLYLSKTNPWPGDTEEVINRLPEDWLELHHGVQRIRSDRKKNLPRYIQAGTDGQISEDGTEVSFVKAPFRFCLNCGVSYNFRIRSDFTKLSQLGSGGRSTATTILALSVIRNLRNDDTLPKKAQKLLSFTDNRQDASLQAGHFNDFIEISILRAALYHAVSQAGDNGLEHDELTQKVFESLELPLGYYAVDPEVKHGRKVDTEKAFRDVLGYRLYRDLRRGWRVLAPNLEQSGLLQIDYKYLDSVCEDEDIWADKHNILVDASPEVRCNISKTLLDYMRRELAIRVDYLEQVFQERIQQRSSQHLIAPWALDENERLEFAGELVSRPRRPRDTNEKVYLSARGGFGMFLRRNTTFPDHDEKLNLEVTQIIIKQLLDALRVGGIVDVVREARDEEDVSSYQLPASAFVWKMGSGETAFHDPIRVPNQPSQGSNTNKFFVDLYRNVAGEYKGISGREHTGQVDYEDREEREDDFRSGDLPVLFCSPTMELGVDISELNVVNMRNIPPTPANYAQRSGRAGRGGQPALVFSYCAAGSSHDQYFFNRPERMVAGSVTPPRLDLANEDLVRAHIHAVWLAETNAHLGASLKDVLDLEGEDPSLEILPSIQADVEAQGAKTRGHDKARTLLNTIENDLADSDWYSDRWLDEIFDQVILRFDNSCDRWRDLYRAALRQSNLQTKIIQDATRSQRDKNQAKRLRREAESQLALLSDASNAIQSDFYSYRYFASEGFLPGYSFPRLPLSAYIPGRTRRKSDGEYINRPRFLAISEFGPRAIVYHEGSRFIINKVILPVERDEDEPATTMAKLCPDCGYLHPIKEGDGPDLCEHCQTVLDQPMRNLFRLQNVATKRRDRINSDEEVRTRQGYEIRTGVRFADQSGQHRFRIATIKQDGELIGTFKFGNAATIWRINLGWRHRKQNSQMGFVLDLERGYWAKNDQEANDPEDPMSPRTKRVIPYVEDRRNCLIFEPKEPLDEIVMTSLQSALKNAIQIVYQLEGNELAAEPMPSRDERKMILFYEAAEGGAGVLRRLLSDPNAVQNVARQALELCHYDPMTGEDLRRAPRSSEDCEAACYDCLMSYSNQLDHSLLDRTQIKDLLLSLSSVEVVESPTSKPRAEHLAGLKNQSDSNLERQWLDFLESNNLHLPSHAQQLIPECQTRPDFIYKDQYTAVYIDGPAHEYEDRAIRDQEKTECMEDLGYTVIRFAVNAEWSSTAKRYSSIFGKGI